MGTLDLSEKQKLAVAGYDEVAIQLVPGQEHAIEDWGKIRRAFA